MTTLLENQEVMERLTHVTGLTGAGKTSRAIYNALKLRENNTGKILHITSDNSKADTKARYLSSYICSETGNTVTISEIRKGMYTPEQEEIFSRTWGTEGQGGLKDYINVVETDGDVLGQLQDVNEYDIIVIDPIYEKGYLTSELNQRVIELLDENKHLQVITVGQVKRGEGLNCREEFLSYTPQLYSEGKLSIRTKEANSTKYEEKIVRVYYETGQYVETDSEG